MSLTLPLRPQDVHLDMATPIVAGVFDAGTGKTTWTLPVRFYGNTAVRLSDGATATLTRLSLTSYEATGNFSGDCILGTQYESEADLSPIMAKDDQNGRPMFFSFAMLERGLVRCPQNTDIRFFVDRTSPSMGEVDITTDSGAVRQFTIGCPAESATIRFSAVSFRPMTVHGYEIWGYVSEGTR